jgi:hypothetical protein
MNSKNDTLPSARSMGREDKGKGDGRRNEVASSNGERNWSQIQFETGFRFSSQVCDGIARRASSAPGKSRIRRSVKTLRSLLAEASTKVSIQLVDVSEESVQCSLRADIAENILVAYEAQREGTRRLFPSRT